jgi:hypothetical protein
MAFLSGVHCSYIVATINHVETLKAKVEPLDARERSLLYEAVCDVKRTGQARTVLVMYGARFSTTFFTALHYVTALMTSQH